MVSMRQEKKCVHAKMPAVWQKANHEARPQSVDVQGRSLGFRIKVPKTLENGTLHALASLCCASFDGFAIGFRGVRGFENKSSNCCL